VIALALLIAVPLAILCTRALAVSRLGPGPGRRRGSALRAAWRALLTFLRAIPEIVWALMLVRVLRPRAGRRRAGAGASPTAACSARSTPKSSNRPTRGPPRSLLEMRQPAALHALTYGLLPNAAQELTSYTVYRWECAVRASVIMGFVGAGGLGQLMDQSMKMLNGGEAATILLVFLLLVVLADALSATLRRALA
jgi:phosphonate transport system permease protein